jgi:hypothetical protein
MKNIGRFIAVLFVLSIFASLSSAFGAASEIKVSVDGDYISFTKGKKEFVVRRARPYEREESAQFLLEKVRFWKAPDHLDYDVFSSSESPKDWVDKDGDRHYQFSGRVWQGLIREFEAVKKEVSMEVFPSKVIFPDGPLGKLVFCLDPPLAGADLNSYTIHQVGGSKHTETYPKWHFLYPPPADKRFRLGRIGNRLVAVIVEESSGKDRLFVEVTEL